MVTNIGRELATQIVQTVKDVCGQDVNFIDNSGIIFTSTNEKRIGTFHEIGQRVARTGETIEVDTDNDYLGTHQGINLPIYHNYSILAVIGITGNPNEVRKYAHLAERITKLLIREREVNMVSKNQSDQKHYLIDSLIRNETTNQEYILHLLEEFKIPLTTPKRILLIQIPSRYNPTNISMLEQIILPFFKELKLSLFTFRYPSEYLALMEDSSLKENSSSLFSFTQKHVNLLNFAIGKAVSLSDLHLSYETALITMKSLADKEDNYAIFDDLTLEFILCALDHKTKEEYISKTISSLEENEVNLLRTYFETDMSLAKTSETLYIHKNTLQYKLNNIHTKTGLDPRRFQDAVILYLATRLKNEMLFPK